MLLSPMCLCLRPGYLSKPPASVSISEKTEDRRLDVAPYVNIDDC